MGTITVTLALSPSRSLCGCALVSCFTAPASHIVNSLLPYTYLSVPCLRAVLSLVVLGIQSLGPLSSSASFVMAVVSSKDCCHFSVLVVRLSRPLLPFEVVLLLFFVRIVSSFFPFCLIIRTVIVYLRLFFLDSHDTLLVFATCTSAVDWLFYDQNLVQVQLAAVITLAISATASPTVRFILFVLSEDVRAINGD